MGIISALGTSKAVERLKTGKSKSEVMSLADIALITFNMTDAQKNLPREQFEDVYALFRLTQQKGKEKRAYTLDEYLDDWTKLTFMFDSIAPFELYCGNDAIAASIRQAKQDPSYYEMRDFVVENPSIVSALREEAEKENRNEQPINVFNDQYSSEKNQEPNIKPTNQLQEGAPKKISKDAASDSTAQINIPNASVKPKKRKPLKIIISILLALIIGFGAYLTYALFIPLSQIRGTWTYSYSYDYDIEKDEFSDNYDAELDSKIVLWKDSYIITLNEENVSSDYWYFTRGNYIIFENYDIDKVSTEMASLIDSLFWSRKYKDISWISTAKEGIETWHIYTKSK